MASKWIRNNPIIYLILSYIIVINYARGLYTLFLVLFYNLGELKILIVRLLYYFLF